MDLPSNSRLLPRHLVDIRGLVLPGTGSTGPPLPPLVSIQGVTTSAIHDFLERPHQDDSAQPLRVGDANSRGGEADQQMLWAGLQEAQRLYDSLEARSREHILKMQHMEDNTRARLEHSQKLSVELASTLRRAEGLQGILQTIVGQVRYLNELQAELAHLQGMGEQLAGEAQAIHQGNAEITKLSSEVAASVDKAERLGKEAPGRVAEAVRLRSQLDASKKEVSDLNTQLAASKGKVKKLEMDAETLRKKHEEARDNYDKLRKENPSTKFDGLKSRLAASESKVKKLEKEADTLRSDDTEITGLKAQLAASEGKVKQLEKEADTLRSDNAEITGLKAQLAASEGKVKQLEKEADTLRSDNAEITGLKAQLAASGDSIKRLEREADTLRDNYNKQQNKFNQLRSDNDQLRKENAEITGLKSQLAASDDNIKRLEREADTLRDNHNKQQNDIDQLRSDNDQLRKENAEITGLRSRLAASEDDVKRLEREAGTLINDNDGLRKGNDELRKGNDELRKGNDELRKGNDELRKGNDELRKKNEELQERNDELEPAVHAGHLALADSKRLEQELEVVNKSKRFYLEKYLSLRGAIRAVCRIRGPQDPSNPQGTQDVRTEIIHDTHGACLEVFRKVKSSLSVANVTSAPEKKKTFWLDQIFSSTDDNDVIWDEIKPLFESALDGAQVVVILYGRTGTGKSYTSEGIWRHLGGFLFADTDDSGNKNDEGGDEEESTNQGDSSCDRGAGDPGEEDVRLWSIEVYCGEIYDLLVTAQKGGKAREGKLGLPSSNGILHPVRQCHASSVDVSGRESLTAALEQVALSRTSGKTLANSRSSRSHSFTCLEFRAGGSITLVDLAGHEKDGVGDSKDELNAINSSLSALTQALGNLSDSLNKADARAPRVQATPKKQKNVKSTSQTGRATPPREKNTPEKAPTTRGIESVWSSPELLPRIIGGLMLRGSEGGEQELKSKVMFLATVDFSTVESTQSSENTLSDLQRVGIIKDK